ncbi:MAG: hypothetical protein V2A54_03290 [Bacteroidota bacterium]
MKNFILTISLYLAFNGISAQNLDTIPRDGFSFPIRSKLILKMVETDSAKYKYYILSYEPFDTIINTHEENSYLSEKPANNTIELLFCVGTHGETQKEKDKNLETLLILKNGMKDPIQYKADIIKYPKENFESTSVVPLYPGALTREMWPYFITEIGLHDFQKLKH